MTEELCCYTDADYRLCHEEAEVEIVEERTDTQKPLADYAITTHSCLHHLGKMLSSEDGQTRRWTVTLLEPSH